MLHFTSSDQDQEEDQAPPLKFFEELFGPYEDFEEVDFLFYILRNPTKFPTYNRVEIDLAKNVVKLRMVEDNGDELIPSCKLKISSFLV